MDCARCGTDLIDQIVHDEQELTCGYCGAVNRVSVDEDGDAWIGHWTCCHDVPGDSECVMCDAEDAVEAMC